MRCFGTTLEILKDHPDIFDDSDYLFVLSDMYSKKIAEGLILKGNDPPCYQHIGCTICKFKLYCRKKNDKPEKGTC